MPNLEDFNITDAARGAAFTVKVVPRASRTELVGIQEDGTIKIRLMAPPVNGQDDAELIAFLADFLGASPDDIEIVAGIGSRKKLVSVLNVRAEEVERIIRAAVPSEIVNDED